MLGKEYKHPNLKPYNECSRHIKHYKMGLLIPKPDFCPICNQKKKLELTNNDHKYSDNIEDWIWKCRSCHKIFDYKHNFKVDIGGITAKTVHLSPLLHDILRKESLDLKKPIQTLVNEILEEHFEKEKTNKK